MSFPPRPRPAGDPGQGDGAVFASAASVAGLARQVEAISVSLAELVDVPARVEEVAALVAALAGDVTALMAEAARSRKPQPSWLVLPAETTVRDAVVLLVELAAWLGAVYLRYPDGVRCLPGCWLWHPDVVEELLWLHRTWTDAYTGIKASASAVGDWHDRLRPGVARRVLASAGVCSVENHQPGRTPLRDPHPATGGVPVEDAVEPIAFWWATNRDAEPPTPTTTQLAAAAAADRPMRGRR